jgi:hypothetical protein
VKPSLERLKGIRARDAKSVLHALAELAQRTQEGASGGLPRVRIDTAAGVGYEGWVHGIEQRAGSCSVLLEQDVSRSAGGLVLSFLELVEPYHLTFPDAGDCLSLFRFGEVPRLSRDGPLTSLQLRRAIEAAKGKLAGQKMALEVAEVLFADSGLANNVLRDVIDALAEYVDKTRNDQAGAAALDAVHKMIVSLARGTPLRTARQGEALVIDLDPQEGFDDKRALFTNLDRLL